MKNEQYKWFTNKACEYYPCHDFKEINCLFCFCPLYSMNDCGGDPILLENGVKDCSRCTLPHSRNGYDIIVKKLKLQKKAKM